MRWSFQVGTLFKIPVRVHWSMLLFLVFVLLQGGGPEGLLLMVGVFASVVVHEVGHALAARHYGLPIVDISLYPFGGMARLAAPPRTTTHEIVVALVGPATSLVLGGLCWLGGALSGSVFLLLLGRINLMLGGFNLLPALPMDGGRVLRAALARRLGFYRATSLSARVARFLAMGMAVWGLFGSGWFLLLAAFLLFMSLAEEASARARLFMGDPGYQDAPGHTRPRYDPFRRFAERSGFFVPGTDWEVLDPDDSTPRPTRHRVVRDSHGNFIVVEWHEG